MNIHVHYFPLNIAEGHFHGISLPWVSQGLCKSLELFNTPPPRVNSQVSDHGLFLDFPTRKPLNRYPH